MSFSSVIIRSDIRKGSFLILLFYLPIILNGQVDRKFIREGNRLYDKDKFSQSETSYRKAIDKNKGSVDAVFNAGDALYRQKKYEEAGKQFVQSQSMNDETGKKSESLYNLGNSLLMAKKLPESIDAYKSSLRINPDNKEAKYNLAYAQDLLREQQEQQNQQDKNNKDQNDQKDNKENKDQNKQDESKDDDQKQDQQQNNKDAQQQPQQQQSISKEDAERLLNAIANDEKNVQEKVKLAKASKERVRTLKNW